MMKNLLLFFFLLSVAALHAQQSTVSTDTIVVHVMDTVCNWYMPKRMHYEVQSKSGSSYAYDDSIRVCGTIVNGFNRQYHLIVYDKNGVKRVEGDFFDQYPNGHVILYYSDRKKEAEGDFRMTGKGKKRRSKGKFTFYGK